MSIKSIDSQITIARTADFGRDNSAIQKRPEVAQDALAQQEKINDAEDQSRVAKTGQSEEPELKPDGDGSAGAGYESFNSDDNKRSKKRPEDDLLVPPANNIIDIRV